VAAQQIHRRVEQANANTAAPQIDADRVTMSLGRHFRDSCPSGIAVAHLVSSPFPDRLKAWMESAVVWL
jgi:hypothetical protein